MQILLPPRLFKATGIATAILLALACSSGTAKAECGDYVHVLQNASGEPGQPVPAHKTPCNGPNCSGKPATPPAPLTIPVSSSEVNELLSNNSGIDDLRLAHARLVREISVTLPSTIPISIFHPPRAV